MSLGGLAKANGVDKKGGMSGEKFLERIYRYPEARAAFDAVSYHPYSSTVASMKESVESIRKIMNDAGDKNKPLYITEVGWATGGPPGGLVVSPEEQAANLKESMIWFKANKDRLNIPSVNWYFWQDVTGAIMGTKKNWDSYAGLFDVNGAAKPSWYAWLSVTGGS